MLRPLLVLAALAAAALAPAAHAAPWRWPVPPREPQRGFAVGPDRFAAGQHRGADLPAPAGTPVRAACGGLVRFAGTIGDAGRTVSVRCGGLDATYLHLGSIAVRAGRRVRAGTVLGTVGRSGRPHGAPHLHLGARRVAGGRYVDPLTLLGAGPPGLGPVPRPGSGPVRVAPRPVPVRAPAPARAPAGEPVPWAAVAGLSLLVLGAVPAAGARRRRARGRVVHRTADARR